MIVVDTHVHVGRDWYEPAETLLFQMQQNNVDKAVLIQHLGHYDNRYQLECVRAYPGRFASVVLVDTGQPDALGSLDRWANEGAAGVRLRPWERSPGADPLAIWRKAEELGLPVSCLGTLETFAGDDFRKLVEGLPGLKIVIEHLGRVDAASPQLTGKVLALAKYPNLYIKLGGFGEILPRPALIRAPTFDTPPPEVRLVYEAFGSHRMMWGSDYPPSGAREGYGNALRFPMERYSFFRQEDKEWAFGKTALSVWKMAAQ